MHDLQILRTFIRAPEKVFRILTVYSWKPEYASAYRRYIEAHPHNGLLFRHKKERSVDTQYMKGLWGH